MVGNCFQPKQTKPSYPTSEQSIDVQKQRKMEDELSHLVSSHNTLCQILEVFDKNKTANEYFKQASDEVLVSGNTGLGVMVIIALEKMCEVIEEYDEDKVTDEELRKKVAELEKENYVMSCQLVGIERILNKDEEL